MILEESLAPKGSVMWMKTTADLSTGHHSAPAEDSNGIASMKSPRQRSYCLAVSCWSQQSASKVHEWSSKKPSTVFFLTGFVSNCGENWANINHQQVSLHSCPLLVSFRKSPWWVTLVSKQSSLVLWFFFDFPYLSSQSHLECDVKAGWSRRSESLILIYHLRVSEKHIDVFCSSASYSLDLTSASSSLSVTLAAWAERKRQHTLPLIQKDRLADGWHDFYIKTNL